MNCLTVFGFMLHPHTWLCQVPEFLPLCLSPHVGIPRTALITPFPLLPFKSFLVRLVFAVSDSELPWYRLASLEHRQDRGQAQGAALPGAGEGRKRSEGFLCPAVH